MRYYILYPGNTEADTVNSVNQLGEKIILQKNSQIKSKNLKFKFKIKMVKININDLDRFQHDYKGKEKIRRRKNREERDSEKPPRQKKGNRK